MDIERKNLNEYSQEELIALNKKLSVYAITWYFKYCRVYKMKPEDKEKPFILAMLDKKAGYYDELDNSPYLQRLENNHRIGYLSIVQKSLSETKSETDREVLKISYEKSALSTINSCLYWFGGEYEEHKKNESNGKTYHIEDGVDISVAEMEYDLQMNDDFNIENGVATDYQAYEYVWNTLQYLNIEELGKLLRFIEKGIKCNWQFISTNPGRKSRKCEIKQVDIETGKVVNTYTTRNELIEKTGIKKSHLSQCIKTSKDNPGNTSNWKKWIGEDGKKYGFFEQLVN